MSASTCSRQVPPAAVDAAQSRGRLDCVDWTRGFAVVTMVLWHSADAWLLPALKQGPRFAFLRFLGGLAAPGFLLLAGLSAALGAGGARKTWWETLRRPFQVVLLGYGLRLQGWLIDGGALLRADAASVWLPLGGGYAALLAGSVNPNWARAAPWLSIGSLLGGSGLWAAGSHMPGRFAALTRVDVLHVIGASLALLAVGERAFGLLRRPAWLLVLGVLVATTTDFLWRELPASLPFPVATYLGGHGEHELGRLGRFPLLPWFAYSCVGAAIGAWLREASSCPHARAREGLLTATALVGALLALCTSEAHRFVRAFYHAEPWATQPGRLTFRIGVILVLLGFGWVWTELGRGRALSRLGKASLRIYWGHMFFAYGILGALWHKQLHYLTWLFLATSLLLLMWRFSLLSPRWPAGTLRRLGRINLEQEAP